MSKEFIIPELLDVEFTGQRRIEFKYRFRVEGASSVFDGQAEIVNNNDTLFLDVLCIDPGQFFWKFLDRQDKLCDWEPLKIELMKKWKAQQLNSSGSPT